MFTAPGPRAYDYDRRSGRKVANGADHKAGAKGTGLLPVRWGPARTPRFRLELDRNSHSVLAYARRSRNRFPRTCNLSGQRRHKFLLTQELR